MKNLKNRSLMVVLALCICTFFNACKETEPKDVEFTISTGEAPISIDSIVDDSSGSDKFYIEYLIVNNNFYRTGCENNNVYLQDVSSVTISEAKISIIDTNGVTLNRYAGITETAEDSTEGNTLMAQADFTGIGDTTKLLSLQSDNFLKYFKYISTNVKVKLKQLDATVPATAVSLSISFKVKGKDH